MYKKLRRQFVEAAAKYEPAGYRTFIEKRKESEEEYLRRGLCEFVGFIPWPYGPSRRCKILAYGDDSSERPFSVLRKLSTEAWLLLPGNLSDGAMRAAECLLSPSPGIWFCSAHHELWIWLLWFDWFQGTQREEPPEAQPAGIDLPPFSNSADMISVWRLDEAGPRIPECLSDFVSKKKGGFAEAEVEPAAEVEHEDATGGDDEVPVAALDQREADGEMKKGLDPPANRVHGSDKPRLSEAERNIIDVIEETGHRLITKRVLQALEEKYGAASEGTTKTTLAALVRRNLLTNRQDVIPKGYGLPEWG